jgi:hypothetical protein
MVVCGELHVLAAFPSWQPVTGLNNEKNRNMTANHLNVEVNVKLQESLNARHEV